jgi:hypothetical protein
MKMMCVNCGRFVGVRNEVFDERVKNFGSESKLLTQYKCRSCRGNGMSNNIIQKQLNLLKKTNKEQYEKLSKILLQKTQPKLKISKSKKTTKIETPKIEEPKIEETSTTQQN